MRDNTEEYRPLADHGAVIVEVSDLLLVSLTISFYLGSLFTVYVSNRSSIILIRCILDCCLNINNKTCFFCQVFQVINSLSYHYNFKLSHLTEILSVVLAKRGPESVSSAAKVNH